jgi:hypothetical protein
VTDLIDLSKTPPEHYRLALRRRQQGPPDRRRAGHLFAQGGCDAAAVATALADFKART